MENENFIDERLIDDEIQPWQRLDNVVRMWAAQSGFEKDQEFYENLKRQHD